MADELGRPVAILRLGARVPDQGPDPNFYFGSPPWVAYPPRTAGTGQARPRDRPGPTGRTRGKEAAAMKQSNDNRGSMRAWRLAIIVLGTLILCSCRGPASHAPNPGRAAQRTPHAVSPDGYAALPPQAYTGMPPGRAVSRRSSGHGRRRSRALHGRRSLDAAGNRPALAG